MSQPASIHPSLESCFPSQDTCILPSCTRLSKIGEHLRPCARLVRSERLAGWAARGRPNRRTRIPPRCRSRVSPRNFRQDYPQSRYAASPYPDCADLWLRSPPRACSVVCTNGGRCIPAHQSGPRSSQRSQASPQWKQRSQIALKAL